MNYLIYETEQRQIVISKILFIEFTETLQTHSYRGRFGDDFKIELGEYDRAKLFDFFEITERHYIKQSLKIYETERGTIHNLYGCFPSEFDDVSIKFVYDYKECDIASSDDKQSIVAFNRDQKLRSIGI